MIKLDPALRGGQDFRSRRIENIWLYIHDLEDTLDCAKCFTELTVQACQSTQCCSNRDAVNQEYSQILKMQMALNNFAPAEPQDSSNSDEAQEGHDRPK